MSESTDSNSTVIHFTSKSGRHSARGQPRLQPNEQRQLQTSPDYLDRTADSTMGSTQDWNRSPSSAASHNFQRGQPLEDSSRSTTDKTTCKAKGDSRSQVRSSAQAAPRRDSHSQCGGQGQGSKLFAFPHKATCPCYICVMQRTHSKTNQPHNSSSVVSQNQHSLVSKHSQKVKPNDKYEAYEQPDKYEGSHVQPHEMHELHRHNELPPLHTEDHLSNALKQSQYQQHSPHSGSHTISFTGDSVSSPLSGSTQTRFKPKLVLYQEEEDKLKQSDVDDVFKAQLRTFKAHYRSGSVSLNNSPPQASINDKTPKEPNPSRNSETVNSINQINGIIAP